MVKMKRKRKRFWWAIEIEEKDGRRVVTGIDPDLWPFPYLYPSREECRMEIRAWKYTGNRAAEWKPRPVKVELRRR